MAKPKPTKAKKIGSGLSSPIPKKPTLKQQAPSVSSTPPKQATTSTVPNLDTKNSLRASLGNIRNMLGGVTDAANKRRQAADIETATTEVGIEAGRNPGHSDIQDNSAARGIFRSGVRQDMHSAHDTAVNTRLQQAREAKNAQLAKIAAEEQEQKTPLVSQANETETTLNSTPDFTTITTPAPHVPAAPKPPVKKAPPAKKKAAQKKVAQKAAAKKKKK